MLWKFHRLCKNWQFQYLIEKGQKISNSIFIIYLLKNEKKDEKFYRELNNNCLLGISIPKSLVKKAVKRNLYKRQIRNMLISYFQKNSCLIHYQHFVIIIIIKKNYLENSFFNNQLELYNMFNIFIQKNI